MGDKSPEVLKLQVWETECLYKEPRWHLHVDMEFSFPSYLSSDNEIFIKNPSNQPEIVSHKISHKISLTIN